MKRLCLIALLLIVPFLLWVYYLAFAGRDSAREPRALADVENLSTVVRAYAERNGSPPTTEQGSPH